MILTTNMWNPPINSCWPAGVRKMANKAGANAYLRGMNNTDATASRTIARTTGCMVLCEAPPPKLK